MGRGNAAGEDGITVELLKDEGDIVLEKLANLYATGFRSLKVLVSWGNANIILIHKNGNVKELKNYRPISLLSVVHKLFTKVKVNRIGATIDFLQPWEQHGFRKDYSAMDRIHVIQQVIEKYAEYNEPLHLAFIDYEKVFDLEETAAAMAALRD